MRKVAIFGSTGILGTKVVNVIRQFKKDFNVFSLTCYKNQDILISQAKEFNPKYICVVSEEHAEFFPRDSFPDSIFYAGEKGLLNIARDTDYDILFICTSGLSALRSTFEVVKKGKTVAIANKDIIIAGGEFLQLCCSKNGARLIPLDSEHSAIFQLMERVCENDIRSIILCASGGPFLNYCEKDLDNITPEQALVHPVWKMGEKITIDSATMMNKALEVIEASIIFNKHQILVFIHPESIIHGMLQLNNGTTLAFLEPPDMTFSVLYALFYPQKVPAFPMKSLYSEPLPPLRLLKPEGWMREAIDLGYRAQEKGHSACISLLASDDVLVRGFLDKKIKFHDILKIANMILMTHEPHPITCLDDIFSTYREEEKRTQKLMKKNLFLGIYK